MAEQKENILFNTLEALFNNKEYIQNLTKEAAKQNIFMINRRLAIKFPLQAQTFNISKINASNELMFWSNYLYKQNSSAPRWIYTAGVKKSQEQKMGETKISQSLIKKYCGYYCVSEKDVKTAIKMFPEDSVNTFKNFETLLKDIEHNGKID